MPKKQPPQKKPDIVNIILMIALGVVVLGLVIWAATRSPQAPQSAQMPPQPSPQLPVADDHDHEALDAIPRITAAELKAKLDAGTAVTVDVRDQQAYIAGHIPGALQIPLEFVQGEIPWYPRDKTIVSYCT